MEIGETLIIQPKDSKGNIIKTITLVRTEAPYSHDLARAYNEAMTREQREQGLLWVVVNGEVRLVTDSAWTEEHSRRLKARAEWGGI